MDIRTTYDTIAPKNYSKTQSHAKGKTVNAGMYALMGVVATAPVEAQIRQQGEANGWITKAQSNGSEALTNEGFTLNNLLERLENTDKGVFESKLTAQEASSSAILSVTKDIPMVFGVFDGANDMGTIHVVNIKRYADGSAKLLQKSFSPHTFAKENLTEQQYAVLEEKYGGNPFSPFKTDNAKYKDSFIKIKPEGLQTAMGLAMQHYGAVHGIYAFLEPKVRTWTTTSGNAFRKKVTTHVEAHFKPHWYLLTPVDVGVTYGTVGKPFYFYNDKPVASNISVHKAEGPNSSFDDSEHFVFYDKKSESGWTMLTAVLGTIVLGAVTGGAAGVFTAGMMSGGAVASYGFLNGTDLNDVVSSNFYDPTAVSDTKSLEYEGDWFMKWRNVMRDEVTAGPIPEDGSKPLGTINDEFSQDEIKWKEMF